MVNYYSTKTFGHNAGLSCVFRQPGASSHCRFLHGYSLKFKFVFGATELDDKNWVVDFGGLRTLEDWLHKTFDHKLAADINDPKIEAIRDIHAAGVANVIYLDGVGCEKFAEHAFNFADELIKEKTDGRCFVVSVECSEHDGNSAIYAGAYR